MKIPWQLSLVLFVATLCISVLSDLGWIAVLVYSAVSFFGMIVSIFPSEAVEVIPYGFNDGRVVPEEYIQLVGFLSQIGCLVKIFWR